MNISADVFWLLIQALPIACISWTVTHEEIFHESQEFCRLQVKNSKNMLNRKFFYVFTCEYCFSHYITILVLFITGFKLLFDDWRGYLIAGFSLVWIANIYMSLYALIRVDLKKERAEAEIEERRLKK